MRRITFVLCILCSVLANAQGIKNGTAWYDGWIDYTATIQQDGNILMEAISEGQELEFLLVPVDGQPGVYTTAKGSNEGADMPYETRQTVKYRHQDGMTVLCVYKEGGKLENVLVMTPDDGRFNNIWMWIPQIKGTYITDPYGYKVEIKDDALAVEGSRGRYEIMTFNDIVIGVLKVEGTPMDGYWRLIPTLEGFNVYSGDFDEYGIFKTADGPYKLVFNSKDTGRFNFASYVLLNKHLLSRYKKSVLRIMRNSILAKHGYRFQSKDLQEYFGAQDWYMPQNNDDVKLSFIEQLNVEMIKTAEADPDHDEYVWEE